MANAISACFGRYATFSGRASRSEFWFFYLFYAIVYVVGIVISAVVGIRYLYFLFILPLMLPLSAAGVRRIHDTGRSGWFYLVPVYNLILLIQSGTTSDNSYGSATR